MTKSCSRESQENTGAKDKHSKTYRPWEIEPKWLKIWERKLFFKAENFSKKPKFYALVEFPYPSGEGLHIGHAFTCTILDVFARKKRMEGLNILYPMGWDAFGLPTENYAIRTGIHPAVATKKNTDNFRTQMKRLALAYNWDREVNTTNPDYYKWTQWIFLQLFKRGLAYKEETPVGWCPACKIILANEEIVAGKCERCGHEAEYRQQKQWLLKITAYADRLADELNLVDYPDYVKASQRNWIGRSKGAQIKFEVANFNSRQTPNKRRINSATSDYVEVFTTRPDTLFGVTAMVLAPEHPLVEKILSGSFQVGNTSKGGSKFQPSSKVKENLKKYVQQAKKKSELERTELAKEKTGVFTGLYCINPVNNESVPIWVGDYVIASYGGGAVMVVPAHDERDRQFAKKYGFEVKAVIKPRVAEDIGSKDIKKFRQRVNELFKKIEKGEVAYEESGTLVNSGSWNGLKYPEDLEKVIADLEKKKIGKRTVSYHLRDWIFSRQHYWGEPIPMVYCEACAKKGISWFNLPETKKYKKIVNCKLKIENSSQGLAGWMPLPENQLPLELPKVQKYQPTATGDSPLANIKSWVKTKCPYCGSPAQRETDTMPNWAGSSWYFLRYIDPENDSCLADRKKLKYWMPVDLYLGGAEHTTLHLLYSRFWHKFLGDIGVVPGKEPYAARRQHGVILGEDGFRMSKSRGNVVNPEDVIEKFGIDTLRVYLMFMGPYDATMPWSTKGVEGCYRFLTRVWRIYQEMERVQNTSEVEGARVKRGQTPQRRGKTDELRRHLHRLIKKVTEDIEAFKHNTAIAAMMEFLNSWVAAENVLSKKDATIFLRLLAPFAPYMVEELWQQLQGYEVADFSPRLSVHTQPWPKYDPKLVKEEMVTIVIQVNGKVRGQVKLTSNQANKQPNTEKLAKKEKNVVKYLQNKKIKKVIFVPGKLINFVTN